jgi:DNA-binding XRE family transcriptional regulator
MRSDVTDIMPANVRRSLTKFGRDIGIARRKRGLTVQMMAERVGIHRTTYLRVEKGDPSVSIAVHAMVLFVLGFGDVLSNLVDQSKDDTGLLLEVERLPKRVRVKKAPKPL